MIRRVLERLSRGTSVWRALPEAWDKQPVLVSPDGRLGYLFRSIGSVDRMLLAWVDEFVRAGSVVWDIGANCGVFAIASALRAGAGGEVVAVEPDPFLVSLLRRSTGRLDGRAAATAAVSAAVAEAPGRAVLHLAGRGRAANWIDGSRPSTQSGGERDAVEVEVVSLDSLLEGRRAPAVVKVDVEGSEARVLTGAARLLREVRPVILVEVSEPCRAAVATLLAEAGYQLFDALEPGTDRVPLDTPVENTLAVPG